MAARDALLIGNSRYRDQKLSRLRTPAGDVKALEAVLGDPAVGGFKVETLVDCQESVLRRRLAEFFADRHPDDLLLCYYSGHGVIDVRRRLYFAVEETDLRWLSGTAYPAMELRQQMDDCLAGRQVLILDCCHSGAFNDRMGDPKAGPVSVDAGAIFAAHEDAEASRGRVVLTATDAAQYAWEGDAAAEASKNQSLFTYHLIEGLRTGAADADGDGNITIDELYAYVRNKVRKLQNPLKWTFKQDGTLVLARNPNPVAMPERLPDTLRADAASEHPHRRLASVAALAEIATRPQPGEALAARGLLAILIEDDSRKVSVAARAALDTLGPRPTEPLAVAARAATDALAPGPTGVAPPVTEQGPSVADDAAAVDSRSPTIPAGPGRSRRLAIGVVAAAACTLALVLLAPHIGRLARATAGQPGASESRAPNHSTSPPVSPMPPPPPPAVPPVAPPPPSTAPKVEKVVPASGGAVSPAPGKPPHPAKPKAPTPSLMDVISLCHDIARDQSLPLDCRTHLIDGGHALTLRFGSAEDLDHYLDGVVKVVFKPFCRSVKAGRVKGYIRIAVGDTAVRQLACR